MKNMQRLQKWLYISVLSQLGNTYLKISTIARNHELKVLLLIFETTIKTVRESYDFT